MPVQPSATTGFDPWHAPRPAAIADEPAPIAIAPHPRAADPAGEHRRAPRTNMFIAATAETEGCGLPVRIRNMSQTGALVEGSALRPAARLVLRRGENFAAGRVAWSDGHRAGIAFDDIVSVSAWMGRPVSREADAQNRVDALQAQIRSGVVPLAGPEPIRPEFAHADLQHRLSEELLHLKRIIDAVGDELTGEPLVLEKHAESMQQFDIVSQTLGHLARVLVAPDPSSAVNHIGMDSLRKRLANGI